MNDIAPTSVLLPLGAESAFFVTTGGNSDIRKGRVQFQFYDDAFSAILQELVSYGGSSLLVAGKENSTIVDSIDHPLLRKRIKAYDQKLDLESKVRMQLSGVARELQFDAARLGLTTNVFTATTAYASSLDGARRREWADLCIVFNALYEFTVGLRTRAAIDIQVDEAVSSLNRLLLKCNDHNANLVPAALLGALRSYGPVQLPALLPNFSVSSANSRSAELLNALLEDAAYLEYSAIREELTVQGRTKARVDHLRVLCGRIARNSAFAGAVKIGQKITSFCLPVSIDLLDLVGLKDRTMPAMVDLTTAVIRSTDTMARAAAKRGDKPLDMVLEGFDWTSRRYQIRPTSFVSKADLNWFLPLYTFNPPLDIAALLATDDRGKRGAVEATFSSLFFENLSTPSRCDDHGLDVSADDVDVTWEWDSQKLVTEIRTCCERAGMMAFAKMAAVENS